MRVSIAIISSFLLLRGFCVFVSIPAASADLVKYDFEDGTAQGWTIVSGDVGTQPVSKDDDRWGGNFGKQGKWFIGTYENTHDAGRVEMRSPEFTISANWMSLLVGGGSYPQGTYIALCDASDGTELMSETGGNSERMRRRLWDVSTLAGRRVYLKLVDRETGGWGHINVDDIRELTHAEAAQIEDQRKERETAKEKWLAGLMLPTERKVYKGAEVVDVAMNLGGIGAGNIAVCGDGALRQWQIFNKVNTRCVVPGQFFAIRTASSNGAVARLLQTPSMPGTTEISETEFIGEFPFAEIRYKDDALPVEVKMEAFSPFIPMDSKDSGIPGIYFVFTVKNPTREQVDVSLAGSLQNAVNYDGGARIDGVRFAGYGGNVNRVVRKSGCTFVSMTNPTLPADARQFGSMALGVLGEASAAPQWDCSSRVWYDFAGNGRFDMPCDPNPSGEGRTWNGALAATVRLRPGETKTVVFFIAWHFPNYYADYDKNLAQYRIGRNYVNQFKNADEVATYMASNYKRLAAETRLFHDTLYDSNLPYWFVDRIGAPASTLTSQTCLWIEDGGFHAFEGCGCCPMNCTHVWNYEMTLSALFPDLERNMRKTDLTAQLEDSGAVRHRTVLPLSAPRETGPFVDGQLGTILKCYREYRQSADRKWLDEYWPRIKKAMDFVVCDWDPNKDGVLVNEQWNTYDAAMYGPNTFIGTLYLGALRAAEEMAKVEGDTDAAAGYRKLFETGSKRLDDVLWNGEYYVHIDDKPEAEMVRNAAWITQDWPNENAGANRPYGSGCHADQLLGQWWANLLDLGYLLPRDRVRTALDSIMKYDWRWDFGEVAQQRPFAGESDMGLLNCTWPKGGRPPQQILYADEVWTGIEYEVAGLLIHEGKVKEGYQIAKGIFDRYNGVRRGPILRSPWNEIECGDHYARAMSSWSMLRAAQGFSYSGPDGLIAFDPRIQPEDHRSLFTTAEGWGTFAQRRTARSQTDTLELKYGQVTLKTIKLGVPGNARCSSVKASLGSRAVEVNQETNAGTVTLHFKWPVAVRAGQRLSISISFM